MGCGSFYDAAVTSGSTYIDALLSTTEARTPGVGDVAYPENSLYNLRCATAGTWKYYIGNIECTKPLSTGWTAYNSGTVVQGLGGHRSLTLPAEVYSGNGHRGEYRTWAQDPASKGEQYAEFGFLVPWGYAGTSQSVVAGGHTDGTGMANMRVGAGVSNNIGVTRYSDFDSAAADDALVHGAWLSDVIFVRLQEDATNRKHYLRGPGGGWMQFGGDVGRTLTFTGTGIGWFGYNADVNTQRQIALVHYEEGAV